MAIIQVRDVSEATLSALKDRAGEQGLTLSAHFRIEFERLAARPTNAEVVHRMARRERTGGPSVADTVGEIRRNRAAS